eukprot:3494978-Rhodomonas_salina.1
MEEPTSILNRSYLYFLPASRALLGTKNGAAREAASRLVRTQGTDPACPPAESEGIASRLIWRVGGIALRPPAIPEAYIPTYTSMAPGLAWQPARASRCMDLRAW